MSKRTMVFTVVAAVLAAIGGSAGPAGAAVEGREVQYTAAGVTLRRLSSAGLLHRPGSPGNGPLLPRARLDL